MSKLMLYENAFLITILALTGFFFAYRKLFGREPLSLVKGWNTIHKRWSTWLALLAAVFLAAPGEIAQALRGAWDALGPDMRGSMPPAVVQGVGWALLALQFAAAMIQQRKLTAIARPAGPIAIAPTHQPWPQGGPARGPGGVDAPPDDGGPIPPLTGEPNRVPPPPMVAPLAGLSGAVSADPAVIVIPDGAKTS